MNKAQLRSHLKQLRHDLPDGERHALSQQICHRLETIDWSRIRVLHCFEPIAELEEVDITAFTAQLHIRYPHLQLYTSRRVAGIWKIVSWHDHNETDIAQFDAVIIPMLGFDSRLHRVGYGGGYYDKFLATQKRTRKIGVCFEVGKVPHIPVEPHDISLDTIITESNIYPGA